MKRFMLSSVVAFAVLAVTSHSFAQESHVAILIDGSSSYGIMHDADYAKRIAKDTTDRLPEFKMRDRITMMPIGDYSYVNKVLETQVSKRFLPKSVPASVRKLVISFPEMIRKRGEPKSTNVIGALAKAARRMDCSNTKGYVFVLSDGAETGQKMALPKAPLFKGCERFVMLGVTGRTPAETEALGGFWMAWAKAAGFKDRGYEDRTEDFLTNYRTIVAETRARHDELKQEISEAFLEKIGNGMQYWVDGGEAGHMVWGSFHFVKPA